MVFIDSKTERGQIPKTLKSTNSESGGGIPRILVGNSDASQGLAAISKESLKEDARKAARELRKKLENLSLSASTPTSYDEGEEKTLLASEQTWTNQKGQKITASVVGLSNETVTFRMPNGKAMSYEITSLSKESQLRLAELNPES